MRRFGVVVKSVVCFFAFVAAGWYLDTIYGACLGGIAAAMVISNGGEDKKV